MLSAIEIRNFQSLHHVALELAPLTVIVGASSSGKSAFTRALRTLTSNRRGSEFISHGEKVATISATTDRGQITLQRGKATKDNSYIVTPTEQQHPLYPQREFSKLEGTTPTEVSEFIGIPSKDPINYAGQFDKPYLLDDTPSEVARVFGALTNVHVIFEAARESNRRKLQFSATLKTRAEDLTQIKERALHYRALKQQLTAITEAEKNLEQARALQLKLSRLTTTLDSFNQAATAIKKLKPLISLTPPDISHLTALQQRIAHLDATMAAEAQAAEDRLSTAARAAEGDLIISGLNQQYTQALIASATCPTCHQSTEHLKEHHHA